MSVFDVIEVWSISSHTRVGGLGYFELKGLYMPVLGIQLQPQICVLSPSPIRLMSPCFNTSIPSQIALQVLDGLFPIDAFSSSLGGK